ncbi:MAG: major capsid protein [Bacillus sp. (in: Bacteria)]|nr:major capsid protein [Bacillus sp. (in: firmicutes)]MCM1427122.1 major capsid protein [Eubacterium sp.]
MAIDIYKTQTMLGALALMPPRPTFLRDRYFPTTDKDVFVTDEVLIEYKDESSRKMAPCVIPKKGGIAIARDGYRTERYEPANVAPERTLTIDDLKKKQLGETLFSQRTPAEREAGVLRDDLVELGALIDTREEYMASQMLFENGYTLKHYADKYGSGEYKEWEIRFYDGEQNDAIYIPASGWTTKSNSFIMDLYEISMMLKRRGLRASDCIFGADVANVLTNNEYLLKLMDNRRLDIINIKPEEQPTGVVSYGKINCNGVMLDLYCYTEEFVDEDGKTKTFVPEGKITVTAPGMGHTMYGSVTQMEEADRQYYTYPAKRVPHITTNAHDSIRTLALTAKPLLAPWFKNSSIVAQVL